jgi:thiol-disulfide isomerase/thioredoxin
MNRFITFILLVCGIIDTLTAQIVEINFPYFGGKEYVFYLNKGIYNDTILSGTFGEDGHLTFTLPAKDKDYAGMVRWSLDKNEGPGFILNHEKFTINCSSPAPAENDIIFVNSVENNYLKDRIQQQRILYGKIDAIYRSKMAYTADDSLYLIFDKEFVRLKNLFAANQQELFGSNLYAAHYLRWIEFLNGISFRIFSSEEEEKEQEERKYFIQEELNMDLLYTSGLWNHIISSTFDLYSNKADFGKAMVKNLERVHSQTVFESLANDLLTICQQYDWADAEEVIFPYLVSSGRIKNPTGRLRNVYELTKVRPGTKAYPVSGQKNLSNTLLIFYESGCGNCTTQLEELKSRYSEIQKKGFRIISIAADTNKEVFDYHAKDFPWDDKIFNPDGFEGVDFKNYGVIGTPTIYVIDKKGIITGRYAQLKDTGILN